LAHVLAGKLRAIAISSKVRSAALPNVPTIAESGYPDFETTAWWAVFAPAQLPPALSAALTGALERVAGSDAFRSKIEPLGVTPAALTGTAFAEFQRSEINKWGAAVRDSGATAE
jgi:tripartite-type tricarboxylate transporter receptor subunit TctC